MDFCGPFLSLRMQREIEEEILEEDESAVEEAGRRPPRATELRNNDLCPHHINL